MTAPTPVTTVPDTGKVVTGFSHFVVAKYAESSGTITYSNGRVASGAVDVSITPSTSDDVNYYHDNALGETAAGAFTEGTADFTVKGLQMDAERMMFGLPAADANGWTAYGDETVPPYLGAGFIIRYMAKGVTYWTPVMLPKIKFDAKETAAATQEENIDFQSQKLSAKIFRADDANHHWQYVGADYSSEADAITVLNTMLSIS